MSECRGVGCPHPSHVAAAEEARRLVDQSGEELLALFADPELAQVAAQGRMTPEAFLAAQKDVRGEGSEELGDDDLGVDLFIQPRKLSAAEKKRRSTRRRMEKISRRQNRHKRK